MLTDARIYPHTLIHIHTYIHMRYQGIALLDLQKRLMGELIASPMPQQRKRKYAKMTNFMFTDLLGMADDETD